MMGMIGSVTSKRQTKIPKEIHDQLQMDQGTRIEWTVESGKATVTPRKRRAIYFAGNFRKPGAQPISVEEMDQATMNAVGEDDERINREWREGIE